MSIKYHSLEYCLQTCVGWIDVKITMIMSLYSNTIIFEYYGI
jgi:hypothetical protein